MVLVSADQTFRELEPKGTLAMGGYPAALAFRRSPFSGLPIPEIHCASQEQ